MRSFVIILALCSLFAVPLVHAKSRPPVLAACAAFAPDGSSAAATTDPTSLVLEITQPSGNVAHLNLDLRYTAPNWQLENYSMGWRLYTCQAFFNRDSDLVAVSVSDLDHTTFKHQLQIAVADLNSKKWIADFTVEPQQAFVPLALAGFLEMTISLAERQQSALSFFTHAAFRGLLVHSFHVRQSQADCGQTTSDGFQLSRFGPRQGSRFERGTSATNSARQRMPRNSPGYVEFANRTFLLRAPMPRGYD